MRRVALLVLVASCYGRDDHALPVTPAPRHTTASYDDVPALTCVRPAPSRLRGVDPKLGGYRVLETDADLEAVRTAMRSGTPSTGAGQRVLGMWGAFDDLRSEMQYCMVETDGNQPELQYELRFSITGNSVASLIEDVHFRRIEGVNAITHPRSQTRKRRPACRSC